MTEAAPLTDCCSSEPGSEPASELGSEPGSEPGSELHVCRTTRNLPTSPVRVPKRATTFRTSRFLTQNRHPGAAAEDRWIIVVTLTQAERKSASGPAPAPRPPTHLLSSPHVQNHSDEAHTAFLPLVSRFSPKTVNLKPPVTANWTRTRRQPFPSDFSLKQNLPAPQQNLDGVLPKVFG